MAPELSQKEKKARIKDEVRIYHYPKIIFLYPTLIASIVAALVLSFSDGVYQEPTTATAAETQTDSTTPTDSESPALVKRSSAVLVTVVFLFLFTFSKQLCNSGTSRNGVTISSSSCASATTRFIVLDVGLI